MSDCLCGADRAPSWGDPAELGTVLAMTPEIRQRWGRLVAIRHNPDIEMHRFIIREYRAGDQQWPTGEYRTTAVLIPWMHDHPTESETPA